MTMSDIDYGCNADDPLAALAVMLDSTPKAAALVRELDALGYRIARADDIARWRVALTKCGAPFDSGPTTIQNGMVAVAREFEIRMNIAANALHEGTMPPVTANRGEAETAQGGQPALAASESPLGEPRPIRHDHTRLICPLCASYEKAIGTLRDALRSVQKLISEAAMTGFNCHDGKWADRLFASQQVTSAALKKTSALTTDNNQ